MTFRLKLILSFAVLLLFFISPAFASPAPADFNFSEVIAGPNDCGGGDGCSLALGENESLTVYIWAFEEYFESAYNSGYIENGYLSFVSPGFSVAGTLTSGFFDTGGSLCGDSDGSLYLDFEATMQITSLNGQEGSGQIDADGSVSSECSADGMTYLGDSVNLDFSPESFIPNPEPPTFALLGSGLIIGLAVRKFWLIS
ncbi:MAG: hypothetical protein WBE86_07255 [Candidatus Acidiferrales bacterium]